MNRIHQQNPIEAGYRTRLSLHTALDISFLDKLCFLLFFLGYVMTEVCSSPSKANDNYKSKMVISTFVIVFIHITTERNNYFKLQACLHCLRSFHC